MYHRGAYNSPLKITFDAGLRNNDGVAGSGSGNGGYWTSTVSGDASQRLYIFQLGNYFSLLGGMGSGSRAFGYSVRCIKN